MAPKTRSQSRVSRLSAHEEDNYKQNSLYDRVEHLENSVCQSFTEQRDSEHLYQFVIQIRLEVVDIKTEMHLKLSNMESIMKKYFEKKKSHHPEINSSVFPMLFDEEEERDDLLPSQNNVNHLHELTRLDLQAIFGNWQLNALLPQNLAAKWVKKNLTIYDGLLHKITQYK
ncbi:hypothetical protein OnM2_055081 [Erysiphe neolycopersici]|uniref:Uncharacterized protein n=1 Tax=Erysiphe neolycopersici TaxID=212602 RepID=A0A420HR89_9PEZI|nr:hypothetical protein OnM2_055081 [Erysiphe neolycopersici]